MVGLQLNENKPVDIISWSTHIMVGLQRGKVEKTGLNESGSTHIMVELQRENYTPMMKTSTRSTHIMVGLQQEITTKPINIYNGLLIS